MGLLKVKLHLSKQPFRMIVFVSPSSSGYRNTTRVDWDVYLANYAQITPLWIGFRKQNCWKPEILLLSWLTQTLNGTKILWILLIPHVRAVTCQNVSHEKVYCSYNYGEIWALNCQRRSLNSPHFPYRCVPFLLLLVTWDIM